MLIEAKNLTVGYRKQVVATNINFTINEGDILCIIGENGAGKSTLIKTILNVIKPLEGELNYDLSLKDKRFGYLPQMSESQNDFPATVNEIVLSGRINSKKFKLFFNKEDKQIALRNMELLQIADLKDKSFSSLSGGQRQRVLIARAMCATEKILFLDEPLNGLDPKIAKDFYNIVTDLHKNGVTIVMISHEVSESLHLASHVLLMGEKNIFMAKEKFIKSKYMDLYLNSEEK